MPGTKTEQQCISGVDKFIKEAWNTKNINTKTTNQLTNQPNTTTNQTASPESKQTWVCATDNGLYHYYTHRIHKLPLPNQSAK